uniref:TLC domain-containing protein n=1 Tax=Noctiluca scintillans TaxID=2966 RepID=A0A7S1AFG9_NOCSC|mmetsp:Transcript_44048/g.116497  ORF Transcript_44048/g.116497 Transcript_44048/m.116497 type:complete len:244 (+) Transcript_44048:32-763(+)
MFSDVFSISVVWILFWLSFASALGLTANHTAAYFSTPGKKVGGFERWRWWISLILQLGVFPSIVCAAAFQSYGVLSLFQWLSASAQELPGFEHWYIYALFGAQTRDMIPRMPSGASMMLKVHHWVVVVACVVVLFTPQGFGLFVAGSFFLELGSAFYNLHELFPDSVAVLVVYEATMPVSNVLALVCLPALFRMSRLPLWLRILFAMADVGVVIGRQLKAVKTACGSTKHDRDQGRVKLLNTD